MPPPPQGDPQREGYSSAAAAAAVLPSTEVGKLIAEGKEPNCGRCKAPFGVLRWRHRCRVCGTACCDKCTARRMHLPSLGYDKPERVCEQCFVAGGGSSGPDGQRGMVGRRVRVLEDHAYVRLLCDQYTRLPEWDQRKSAFCGLRGSVEALDPLDGTLKVVFDNGTHSWYPPLALVPDATPHKRTGGTTVEVERIAVTCPCRPELEGPYAPLDEPRNRHIVYAMGPRRLYSNAAGHWVISSTPDGMERETGAIQSGEPHRGKGPSLMAKGTWQRWQRGAWHTDPALRVQRVLVPKDAPKVTKAPPVEGPVARPAAAAPAAAAAVPFEVGAAVMASGLVMNPELNGRRGVVIGHQTLPDGSMTVQVSFGEELSVALRAQNLAAAPPQDAAHATPQPTPSPGDTPPPPQPAAPPGPRDGDLDALDALEDSAGLGGPLFSEAQQSGPHDAGDIAY
eukprot:TRINITY_DN71211_c0_g1_i1.p1 TRINITY_DN71211_c0_g1~~TRINITY_DN71211_c0_g1_i1.p1  ORF type:complete len:452 (+),score=70.30 TRINITY_DN71211_c0_g1_i1:82-1437(+)